MGTARVSGILVVFMLTSWSVIAQTTVEIRTQMAPPGWALMERQLLVESARGCELFADRFLDDRGYLPCTEHWGGNDGPDDAMENFYNWTLLYALGAPGSVLDLYRKAWEGHLRQYAEATAETVPATKDGMYYKEFVISFDWEHNGEGLAAFLFYGLADPADQVWQKRLKRFAGFYMNEDPEAPNYDPEHKIIRSLHNGSRGPKLTPATVNDWGGDPVPGQPDRLDRYKTASNIKGDHPLNLCATTLAMEAYMLGHEEKYRDWVLEYSGAWKDRIVENGGNTPTNIGLDGTIGGEWGGKWYGGVFGWNFWPESSARNYYSRGLLIAFGNSLLLTNGDQSWVDVLRMQKNNIVAAVKFENGRQLLPNKYGDNGWYGYSPADFQGFERDIYLRSMMQSDLDIMGKDPWIQFLEGNNPEYPERALAREFSTLNRRVRGILEDTSTPDTRDSDYPQRFDPAMTAALVSLMCGGNDPGSPGSILHTNLWFFDPAMQRPGLPQDVASLVTAIRPDHVTVTLVNVNQTAIRDVIVQTGAYGEHQCVRVETGGTSYQIDNRNFLVRLAPGAGAELVVYLNRYVNQPTLAHPWHGDAVPML